MTAPVATTDFLSTGSCSSVVRGLHHRARSMQCSISTGAKGDIRRWRPPRLPRRRLATASIPDSRSNSRVRIGLFRSLQLRYRTQFTLCTAEPRLEINLRPQLHPSRRAKPAEPHRADDSTRLIMVILGRRFAWRDALVNVRPDTFVRWHRKGFRLLIVPVARPPGRRTAAVRNLPLSADRRRTEDESSRRCSQAMELRSGMPESIREDKYNG